MDDQELALRQARDHFLREDIVDYEEWAQTAERILRGSFTKPFRLHTVFR